MKKPKTEKDDFQKKTETILKFLKKQTSVQYSVQLADSYGRLVHFTNMSQIIAMGAINTALEITKSGIHSHQHLDSFVQAVERRPDMIDRIYKAFAFKS